MVVPGGGGGHLGGHGGQQRIGDQIRDQDRSQDMGFNIRIRIWELDKVDTGLGMDQGQREVLRRE